MLLVLQNLHLAFQMSPETYVAYSRNKNTYSKADAGTAPFKVSYGATIKIVDGLYELSVLEGKNGIHYDGHNPEYSFLAAFVARMRAKPTLSNLFPGAEAAAIKIVASEKELIILRDESDKAVSFVDNEEIRAMRAHLHLINSVNRRHFIALCMLDEEFRNLFRRINSDRYSGSASADIYFGNTDLRRIFCNGTFEEGGRYYGGWWENLPKEYRKFIRIDNRYVEELDYSCLHPTLLYLEEGLPVPEGDLYEVPGFPPEARKFLKVSMNIILNTKGRDSAKKAIRQDQRRNPDYPELPEGMTLDELFDGFLEKHAGISHHFFKRMGTRLQRIDSDIAEAVMLKLARKDIPVLPLHDSFLVSRVHKDALAAAMNEAISDRYKTQIKVKLDPSAWSLIYDIGIEEEYGHDPERYEREATRDLNRMFLEYNRQYERFKLNQSDFYF
ncbi:MAG: hypothetical protein FPO08_05235 [Geobacter sp.]|nr:MAG: hypothetical protein FPO08_05235 [Geobacter sp.]